MKPKEKKFLGNLFLVVSTIIFFLSLIYMLSFLDYGLIVYTLIVLDIVLFAFIAYSTCKICRISLKYEKGSRIARMIPYMIFLAFMVNITGLFRLKQISFLEQFIQIIVLAGFFAIFIYWARKL